MHTFSQRRRSTLISPRLPSPVTIKGNRPTRGILPRFSRPPILCNNGESNLNALVYRQP